MIVLTEYNTEFQKELEAKLWYTSLNVEEVCPVFQIELLPWPKLNVCPLASFKDRQPHNNSCYPKPT